MSNSRNVQTQFPPCAQWPRTEYTIWRLNFLSGRSRILTPFSHRSCNWWCMAPYQGKAGRIQACRVSRTCLWHGRSASIGMWANCYNWHENFWRTLRCIDSTGGSRLTLSCFVASHGVSHFWQVYSAAASFSSLVNRRRHSSNRMLSFSSTVPLVSPLSFRFLAWFRRSSDRSMKGSCAVVMFLHLSHVTVEDNFP